MKKLLCLMGGVMLIANIQAQKNNVTPYFVNQRIPNFELKNIINYKDSVSTLSSFGHKLILLDFWNIHCTACIAMFPKEDSLQRRYKSLIQIILITSDTRSKVASYLEKWRSTHTKPLELPMVTDDHLMSNLFRHMYIPHYVWIAPDGQLLGETSDAFINGDNIEQLWQYVLAKEKDLKNRHFSKKWFHFPELKENKAENN